MWLSHFSPLFDLALEHPGHPQLEHALYLVSALLFWWPGRGARTRATAAGLPGAGPVPAPPDAGELIPRHGDPVRRHAALSHYATLGSPYGIDALADQQTAAGIMWLAADVVFMAAHPARRGGVDAQRGTRTRPPRNGGPTSSARSSPSAPTDSPLGSRQFEPRRGTSRPPGRPPLRLRPAPRPTARRSSSR